MLSRIILFGLGNPGPKYEWTPHNLGFHVLDSVASRQKVRWNTTAPTHDYAEYRTDTIHVFLVKPTAYVNLAGGALHAFAGRADLTPAELLVIVDDIALPFGRLRLRRRGSHGGHNGLRSVGDALGTDEYARLRMGVGPVPDHVDPADFVLAPFGREERDEIDRFVGRAVGCIETVLAKGFEHAMSLHNTDPESD